MQIELKGVPALKDKIRALQSALDDAVFKATQESGKEVQATAKMLAPVGDSGELRNSITEKTEREGDVVVSTVGTNCEHAPYPEFGTGQRGAAYTAADKAPNIVGYRADWAGMSPQPYLYPALKAKEKTLKAKYVDRILRAIKKVKG